MSYTDSAGIRKITHGGGRAQGIFFFTEVADYANLEVTSLGPSSRRQRFGSLVHQKGLRPRMFWQCPPCQAVEHDQSIRNLDRSLHAFGFNRQEPIDVRSSERDHQRVGGTGVPEAFNRIGASVCVNRQQEIGALIVEFVRHDDIVPK